MRTLVTWWFLLALAACHGASTPPGPDAGAYCVRKGLNGPCIPQDAAVRP